MNRTLSVALILAILLLPLSIVPSMKANAQETAGLATNVVRIDGLDVLKSGVNQNVSIELTYNASQSGLKVYRITILWNASQLDYVTIQGVEAWNSTEGAWEPIGWSLWDLNKTAGYVVIAPAPTQSALIAASGNPPQAKVRVILTFKPIVNTSETTTLNVKALTDDGTLAASDTIYLDAEAPTITFELPGSEFAYDNVTGWIMPNGTNATIMFCDDYGITDTSIDVLASSVAGETPYAAMYLINESPTWTEAGLTLAKCWAVKLLINATDYNYFNLTATVYDAAGFETNAEKNYIYADSKAPQISDISIEVENSLYVLSDVYNTINITITDNYGWTLDEAKQLAQMLINESSTGVLGSYTVTPINNTSPNEFGRYENITLVYKFLVQSDGYVNISFSINDLSTQTAKETLTDVFVAKTPITFSAVKPINNTYIDFSSGGNIYVNVTLPVADYINETGRLAENAITLCGAAEAYLNGTEVTIPAPTITYLGNSVLEIEFSGITLPSNGPFNMTIQCSDIGGHTLNVTLVYTNDVEPPSILGYKITSAREITVGSTQLNVTNTSQPTILFNVTDNYLFNLTDNPTFSTLEEYLGGNFTQYFKLISYEVYPNTSIIELVFQPIQPLNDSKYTLTLSLRDNVAYPETALASHNVSKTFSFVVDTKPPKITLEPEFSDVDVGRIYSASNTEWYIANATTTMWLAFDVSDPLLNESSIAVYLNGTQVSTMTPIEESYEAQLNLSQGNVFNVTIVAKDYINNTATYTLWVIRDTEAPKITYSVRKLGVDNNGGAAGLLLTISLDDNLKPLDTIKLYLNDTQLTVNLTGCSQPELHYVEGNATSISSVKVLSSSAYCGFGKIVINVTAFNPASVLNVTVEAEDVVGNTNVTQIASVPKANEEYTFYLIRLYGGWNLISLPVVTKIDVSNLNNYLFSGDKSKITAVYTYANGSWKSAPVDFTTLEDGKGYFLYVKAPLGKLADVLLVCGTKHPLPSSSQPSTLIMYNVKPGWNLVGFTYQHAMNASQYFNSIKDILVGVWGWDPELQAWVLVYHSAVGDKVPMIPGMGYFIYTSGSGIIVPPVEKLPQ